MCTEERRAAVKDVDDINELCMQQLAFLLSLILNESERLQHFPTFLFILLRWNNLIFIAFLLASLFIKRWHSLQNRSDKFLLQSFVIIMSLSLSLTFIPSLSLSYYFAIKIPLHK